MVTQVDQAVTRSAAQEIAGEMIFDCSQQTAHLSTAFTREPGELRNPVVDEPERCPAPEHDREAAWAR